MVDAGVEVAVDFTHVDAARDNLTWAGEHGVHVVVGTTGFGQDDYDRFAEVFSTTGCFIAPNFAIGAVLMMRFAELAAPYFETAEIIELHHDHKLDAPVGHGHAHRRAHGGRVERVGRRPDPAEVLDGARGGTGAGRHPGPLGPAAGTGRPPGGRCSAPTGQSLSIRHDSYDRRLFMPGVLLAVKAVADRPGVTVGLDKLLGL